MCLHKAEDAACKDDAILLTLGKFDHPRADVSISGARLLTVASTRSFMLRWASVPRAGAPSAALKLPSPLAASRFLYAFWRAALST
jgi:hypothetical protein